VRDQEKRVGGLYLQHRVWPEISSLPVRNEKGHCRATGTNSSLLEIMASLIEMRFNNLPITPT
jgi:hypothetical protein